MDNKINQTNNTTIDNLDSLKSISEIDNQLYPSKEVLQFIRLELKSHMFRTREEKKYGVQFFSLYRRKQRNEIDSKMYEKMKAQIDMAFDKIKENKLWQYKNRINYDFTTLHIVYNHLRRGDRRPHLKSIETELEYINIHKSTIDRTVSFILSESSKLAKKEVIA